MTNKKKCDNKDNPPPPLHPPLWRDIDIGCGLGVLVLDFQYLCIVVTRIDLSPEMVDRDTKRSVTVVVDGGG